MNRLVAALLAIYVSSHGFDSALRWALGKVGAGAAIYLRDLVLVLIVVLCTILGAQRLADFRQTVVVFWIMVLQFCVGLASGLDLQQVLFGLKIWLPFIAGFMVIESGAYEALDTPKLWRTLWAILCFGVFVNYFYRYPWTGLLVQVGDSTVIANREWTAWGIRRLSGFSRSSYDGAMLILLLYLYLYRSASRASWRFLMTSVTAGAIALTTAKGAAGALLCTIVFIPVFWRIRSPNNILHFPMFALLAFCAVLGLVAPLISTQFTTPTFVIGTIENWLFASMVDRGWTTWPQAFELLEGWQTVFGRGLGGIGGAQNYFEPLKINPADNLFVYLYVTAGIVGLAIYLAIVGLSVRLSLNRRTDQTVYLALIAIFSYGITANVIENAMFGLAIGAIMAYLISYPGVAFISDNAAQYLETDEIDDDVSMLRPIV